MGTRHPQSKAVGKSWAYLSGDFSGKIIFQNAVSFPGITQCIVYSTFIEIVRKIISDRNCQFIKSLGLKRLPVSPITISAYIEEILEYGRIVRQCVLILIGIGSRIYVIALKCYH